MVNKCCEFMLHQIAFYKDTIRPCCSFSIQGDITPFINNYNGEINEIKNYLEKRQNFIKIFQDGGKPECYNGCTTYQECKDNDEISFKLNNIIISNHTKCSCNCMYCEQAEFGQNKKLKTYLNTRIPYDIKPILLHLRANNYIEENCRYIICGGECSEYPKGELEWLIYFCMHTKGNLLLLSSGINYSNAIEKALKSSESILKISVDSGTKPTYERIKRVKAYDRVWKNIKNYIKSSENNSKSRVELKYILLKDINDNKNEIDKFLKKCEDVNCRFIILDVEHQYIKANKYNETAKKEISELLNYFFSEVSKYPNHPFISLEGVEEDWLWSLVDDKYNYKNGKQK